MEKLKVDVIKIFRSIRRRGAGLVNDPTEGRALDKSEPRTEQDGRWPDLRLRKIFITSTFNFIHLKIG